MTSILFLIEIIYSNIFRCNYLKKKVFLYFVLAFSNFSFNFEHFQKKIILMADVFLNLRTPKNMVR